MQSIGRIDGVSLALGEYTDDQIMVMVRKGKQRGHIPGVGRVLAGRGKDMSPSLDAITLLIESGAGGDDESGDDEDADEDEEDEDC
ncbi:hypothetical protein Tco_1155971 [Tanacetum coccineum]